ncbi:MAG: hypothetical protein ACU84J_09825 [Gammaproteobacteria bacterium]
MSLWTGPVNPYSIRLFDKGESKTNIKEQSMNETNANLETEASNETKAKPTHPLIQLGIVAIGTKIGAELILRFAKHPLLLFGMGIAGGVYLNKNRKDIAEAADQIKDMGLKVIRKKADD